MSPLLALRLVTYLTVADGIAALLLAGLIAPLGAGLVGAAVLASWWLERARERGAVTQALSWVLVGLAAVALTVDLLYLAATVLDGMVHVLLFVILARLIMCRSLRDLRDAGFLSFFLLVATASVTFSMGFLAVFVAYLALATWMMMLNHIVTESDQAGRRDLMVTRLGLRGQMIRVSLAAAGGTFVIAGILFFLIPRVEQATLPLRAQFSRMVTGFSERVDLGSFGDIESDKTVVMRVQFPDDGIDPPALPNLRWRGIVFDTFDGRTWSVGRPARRLVARGPGGQFLVGDLARAAGPWCARRCSSIPSAPTSSSRRPARCASTCAPKPSTWMTWAPSRCRRRRRGCTTSSSPSWRRRRRRAPACPPRARPCPSRSAAASFSFPICPRRSRAWPGTSRREAATRSRRRTASRCSCPPTTATACRSGRRRSICSRISSSTGGRATASTSRPRSPSCSGASISRPASSADFSAASGTPMAGTSWCGSPTRTPGSRCTSMGSGG